MIDALKSRFIVALAVRTLSYSTGDFIAGRPYSRISRIFLGRSFTGVSMLKPILFGTAR